MSFKNVVLFLMATSLFFVSPFVAAAEKQGKLKVGIVDLQKVLASSKAGHKAQEKFKAETKDAQAKLDKKKQAFDKLKEDFQKQQKTLSASARDSKQEKLIQMDKDLKRSVQDLQEGLQRKNNQLVAGLVTDVRGVIQTVGKEKGFTVIFERGSQSVLYADNTVDITNEVVQAFDKSKQ